MGHGRRSDGDSKEVIEALRNKAEEYCFKVWHALQDGDEQTSLKYPIDFLSAEGKSVTEEMA